MRISYVLPVHNAEDHLESSVLRLTERLQAFPGSEVVLIVNGSSDTSLKKAGGMASSDPSSASVRTFVSRKGLGMAYRAGMAEADGDLLVLTHSDLPFGFTDLDGYLALREPRPGLVCGSKSHHDSVIKISWKRRLMSRGFRLMRDLLLPGLPSDTQGTLLISTEVAQAVLPHLRSKNYLITTEIVALAKKMGYDPEEVPVEYPAQQRTTISPLRDSILLAWGLLTLRLRLIFRKPTRRPRDEARE